MRVRELSDRIVRTVRGPMWHGNAVLEQLAGVSAEDAAEHPIPGAHSIWELVAHVTSWAEIARQRMAGRAPGEATPDQDWPALPQPTESNWHTALARLEESHRALASDVAKLDDAALAAMVPGREYSAWELLHGVVEHGTYHGGQIALLKRALAAMPARNRWPLHPESR